MSAKGEAFNAGSAVTIIVDDSKFTGWKKLELYDGAMKVGELADGPARFAVLYLPSEKLEEYAAQIAR